MFRLAAAALLGLLLTSCAAVPQGALKVASLHPIQISDELDCMADCLEGVDGDCESCATSCLRGATPQTRLTMGR